MMVFLSNFLSSSAVGPAITKHATWKKNICIKKRLLKTNKQQKSFSLPNMEMKKMGSGDYAYFLSQPPSLLVVWGAEWPKI